MHVLGQKFVVGETGVVRRCRYFLTEKFWLSSYLLEKLTICIHQTFSITNQSSRYTCPHPLQKKKGY